MNTLKQVIYLTIIIVISGCAKLNELGIGKKEVDVSTTNQAPTQQKFVTGTTTETETLPDGTVVTTETTVYEDKRGNVTTAVNIRGKNAGEYIGRWDKSEEISVPDTPPTKKTDVAPNSLAIDTAPRVNSGKLPRPRSVSPPSPAVSENADTARDAPYMTNREKDMIREINIIRSDPKAYIKQVQTYKARVKQTTYSDPAYMEDELRAIDDLIRELKLTNPMPHLMPRETLYWTTQEHGVEILANGVPSHVSNDGKYPWDRIIEADPKLEDGNENLIGGYENVKESVLSLLIDSGVPGYGHRKIILNPTWKYVACYEIGDVGETPYYWVQCFAR